MTDPLAVVFFPSRLHSAHLSAAKQQVLLVKLQEVSGIFRGGEICIHDNVAHNITTIEVVQPRQKHRSEGRNHAGFSEDGNWPTYGWVHVFSSLGFGDGQSFKAQLIQAFSILQLIAFIY